ncbi:unnamed protein product, partial [Polarella glacialis]
MEGAHGVSTTPQSSEAPSSLAKVLQLGAGFDGGSSPLPPLASAIAAFLGATAAARLGRCACGWRYLVPTGLRGAALRSWAREHWQPGAFCNTGGSLVGN